MEDLKYKPKFKIGQAVMFKNTYNFNLCEKAVTISTVTSITIRSGKNVFGEDIPNARVIYNVANYELDLREDELQGTSNDYIS